MAQETSELKLRIETMTKTINTAELDSKASRYIILRESINHFNYIHSL